MPGKWTGTNPCPAAEEEEEAHCQGDRHNRLPKNQTGKGVLFPFYSPICRGYLHRDLQNPCRRFLLEKNLPFPHNQQSKGSQSKYAEISAHPFVAFCLYQRVTVDFRCIWIFRNEYEEEMGKRREIFPAEIFIELHHFRRRCPYSIGNGFQPIANRGRGAFFKLTERQEIAGTNLFSPCPPERFPWHQERKLAGKLVKTNDVS